MGNSTDATIEISCSECDEIVMGVDAMEQHILGQHPSYSPHEAAAFAIRWMEKSYDNEDQANAAYYKQRKEDPSE